MSIFLSHTTALSCLRQLSLVGELPQRRRQCPLQGCHDIPPAPYAKASLPTLAGDDELHVLVFGSSQRMKRQNLRCHIWNGKVPAFAFMELAPDVYLSSPEFCFLQMASTLSLPSLIQLGYELCGCYAMSAEAPRGFERTSAALTTPQQISVFLNQAGPCYGGQKAYDALRWVVANSWSPMETDTSLLLSLPTKMGGYQMPFPQLNAAVPLKGDNRIRAKKGCYYLDLHWPNTKIALEFNGTEHLAEGAAGKDRTREIILGQMGFHCIVITARQAFRADEFDTTVKALCRLLGRKYRRPTQAQMEKKYELRRELFRRFGANSLIG